jgi:hypothetical protein
MGSLVRKDNTMVATKRLARLLSVSIVAMGVLVAVAAPSASAHRGPTIAKGLIPAVGSCEFFDKETQYFSTPLTIYQTTYWLAWKVIFTSEFNWATHAYCGQAIDTVCMTTPYPYIQSPETVYNQFEWSPDRNNGHYIGTTSGRWNWTPNMTECVASGPFSIAGNDYVMVGSWVRDWGSNNISTQTIRVGSRPIGQW